MFHYYWWGGVLGPRTFTTQQAQALNLQKEVARRVVVEVAAFIQDRESELRFLTDVQGLPNLTPEQQRKLFSGLLSSQNVYEELVLLDDTGRETLRFSRLKIISDNELNNRRGLDEFEKSKSSGETYYSSVKFDAETREPFMTIAIPLFDLRDRAFIGVLVANFRFKTVWKLMANAYKSGSGHSLYC